MKQRYAVILAATHSEARQYAKRLGMHPGRYRIAMRRGQLAGLQVADAHVLPSFRKAPQRHSILAGLKWGRDIQILDVEMPPAPVEDQGDGMGEQLTIEDLGGLPPEEDTPETRDLVEAALEGAPPFDQGGDLPAPRLELMRDLADDVDETEEAISGVETGEAEQGEDAASTEEDTPKPRRRRKRCQDCGELKPLDEPHECPAAAPISKDGWF